MYLALIIIAAIVAVLLVLIVLIQNSKGGGLSNEFGGSGTAQMFGVKKTTDLLEQITWGFAGAIVILSLASYAVAKSGNPNAGGINSANIEKAQSAPVPAGSIVPTLPDATVPAGGEASPAAPADSTK
jgi:preprotein translocase subunit SecG